MPARILNNTVVLLLALGIGVFFVISNPQYIERLRSLDFTAFSLMMCIQIFTVALRSMRLRVIARYFGVRIPFLSSLRLTFATSFLNYVPLHVGLAYRAVYLEAHYGMSYPSYGLLVTASVGVTFLFSTTLVIFLAIFLTYAEYGIDTVLFYVLGPLLTGSLLFLYVFPKVAKRRLRTWGETRNARLLEKVYSVCCSWCELTNNHALLKKLLVNDAFIVLSLSVRLYLAFWALQVPVGFVESVMISTGAQLSGVVPLVPGAIGVREGLSGVFAATMGLPIGLTILASAVDRIGTFIVLGVFGTASLVKYKQN